MRSLERAYQLYHEKLEAFHHDSNLQKEFAKEVLHVPMSSLLWPRQHWQEYSSQYHILLFGKPSIYPLVDLEHRLDWFAIRLREEKKSSNPMPGFFPSLLLTLFQSTVLQPLLDDQQGAVITGKQISSQLSQSSSSNLNFGFSFKFIRNFYSLKKATSQRSSKTVDSGKFPTEALNPLQRKKVSVLIDKVQKLKIQWKVPAKLRNSRENRWLFLDILNSVYDLDLFLGKTTQKLQGIAAVELENQRLSLDLGVCRQYNMEWKKRYQKLKEETEPTRQQSLYVEQELLRVTEGLLEKDILPDIQAQAHHVSEVPEISEAPRTPEANDTNDTNQAYEKLLAEYELLLEKCDSLASQNSEMRKVAAQAKSELRHFGRQNLAFNFVDIRERVNKSIQNPKLNNHQLIHIVETEIEQLSEFRKMIGKLYYNLGVLHSRVGSHARSQVEFRVARQLGITGFQS